MTDATYRIRREQASKDVPCEARTLAFQGSRIAIIYIVHVPGTGYYLKLISLIEE